MADVESNGATKRGKESKIIDRSLWSRDFPAFFFSLYIQRIYNERSISEFSGRHERKFTAGTSGVEDENIDRDGGEAEMRRELLINRPMPRSGVKFLEEKEARDERGMQLLQVSMKIDSPGD